MGNKPFSITNISKILKKYITLPMVYFQSIFFIYFQHTKKMKIKKILSTIH